MLDKSAALTGTAIPAVSSLGCADLAERLQHGKTLPARNSTSSREALSVELMQPLQRSKSEPVYAEEGQDTLIRKARGQAAPYSPMASLARESIWYIARSAPHSPTQTVGMEIVQPDLHSRRGLAVSSSSLADVELISNQRLRNGTDLYSSMNSEIRLALLPLLEDVAVAVTAAKQFPTGQGDET